MQIDQMVIQTIVADFQLCDMALKICNKMLCCFTSGFKRRNHFVDIAWKGVPREVIQNNRIVTAAAVGGKQPLQNFG